MSLQEIREANEALIAFNEQLTDFLKKKGTEGAYRIVAIEGTTTYEGNKESVGFHVKDVDKSTLSQRKLVSIYIGDLEGAYIGFDITGNIATSTKETFFDYKSVLGKPQPVELQDIAKLASSLKTFQPLE
jgi:hypothetical protein